MKKAVKIEFLLLIFIISWTIFLNVHTFFGSRLWFWNLFSIVPPLIFPIISLALLLLALKVFFLKIFTKEVLLIVTLCIIAFSQSILVSDINVRAIHNRYLDEAVEETAGIKFFNWNTEFWEDTNTQSFYEYIAEQHADVYHLQEYMYKFNEENMLYDISDIESLQEYFPDYEIIVRDELVTITRFPISEVAFESGNKFMRVDLEIQGEVISFYNVHIPVHIHTSKISTPVSFIQDVSNRHSWRSEQFDLLERDLLLNTNQYIISGDFNTTKFMGHMDNILDMTKDSVDSSAWLFPNTWETLGMNGWRIDYVLGSSSIDFLSHKTISPEEFSDHRGVLTIIGLETV